MNKWSAQFGLVAAVLILLTAGGSAWAECAWVLWQENTGDRVSWEIQGAHKSLDECQKTQMRIWEVVGTRCDREQCPGVEKVSKVAPNYISLAFKGGGYYSFHEADLSPGHH